MRTFLSFLLLCARNLLDVNSSSKATVGYWGEPLQKQIKTSLGGELIQLTD